jgi:hypothetical protein
VSNQFLFWLVKITRTLVPRELSVTNLDKLPDQSAPLCGGRCEHDVGLAVRLVERSGACSDLFVRDNDGATETVIMFRILRLTIIC